MNVRPGGRAALLCAAAGALFAPRPIDIDVGVPPGSPLEWSASFPAYTPPAAPLFPRTAEELAALDPEKTVARGGAPETAVRFANAFGQVRILTWDIGIHLPWTQPSVTTPVTPAGMRPAAPMQGEPLYWLALAPLLRLLLHPDALSRSETLAHVLEFGESALPVLAAASNENDLAPTCRELRALIRVDIAGEPAPPRGATPRDSALARFVLEECLRDQPLDPTGDFGRRLFLFAEDAEPHLRAYAQHPSLALARNAVAALGRYETRAAVDFLAAVAARTEDPVTLVRALAALGRFRGPLDIGPLVQRLQRTKEPVQRAALIGALGRMGARDAAPLLLELGERARRDEDSDLLIGVLSAFARIPAPREHAEIVALCTRIAAEARSLGERAKATIQPDLPDRPTLRAEILQQLALLARTQVHPDDEKARAEVLALAKPGPLDPRTSETGVGGNDPLASLPAPTKVLYLEGLQRCGPAGLEQLASLARRPELEPGLRGRALGLLSKDGRASLAPALLQDTKEPVELRVHALELLIRDRHDRVVDLCRAQLVNPALSQPHPAAGELFLALRALRFLSETAKLRARDVLPLYPFVQQPLAARLGLVRELEKRLAVFVAAARDGERKLELEKRAGALFDFVLENQMNPLLEAGMRDHRIGVLVGALDPARGPDPAPNVIDLLVPQLVVLLLGGQIEVEDPGRRLFRPSVPLAEEVLLALGRTREPLAVELLFSVLRGGAPDLRGHAALALGMCAQRAVAGRLLPLLRDADPFVRFCASESLRHLTSKEMAVDWMYGSTEEREAAAAALERSMAEAR